MKHWIWVLALCAACLGAAQASTKPKSPAAATAKAEQKKTKKPKKQSSSPSAVVFVAGSEETAGQRSARLARECKGRPNAGACSGHAN